MAINYHNRKFQPILNSDNGDVTLDMIFEYQQEGNIVTCSYSGAPIKYGQLIGLVDKEGNIDIRYHQINAKGELMTGVCKSTPEVLANGKIKLAEVWYWTSGDKSKGSSVLMEI